MATQEKLTLDEWVTSLGMSYSEMAEKAGVTQLFVKQACKGMRGTPMQASGVMKILDVLSQEHGFTVTPDMIQDLKIMGG
jgi:predicted transcriptional regulator